MLFYPKGAVCVATWMEDSVKHTAKLKRLDNGMVVNMSELTIPKGAVVTITYATATLTDVHQHDPIDYGRTWNILQINAAADCLARSRQAAILWLLENLEALKEASSDPNTMLVEVAGALSALKEGSHIRVSDIFNAVKAVLNKTGDKKPNKSGDKK